MTTDDKATAVERWEVWYDVYDSRGLVDSEMKEFLTEAEAIRFAKTHEYDESPAVIDHYVNDQLV